LSIFYSLGDYGILEIAKILDAVRYAEHQIFFSRSIPEILFGNGLGSGIYDINSYLGFVNYWQSAFSQEEIQSNYFYNLHDYWIDFGLRFGLLSVLIVLYLVSIGQMLKGNIFYGIMMGCLLINVTYSGSGIILVALMHKFYRHNFEQQQ